MGREDLPQRREGEPVNDGEGVEGVSSRRFEEAFDLVKKIKELNGEDKEPRH
jgi:hypothetical protein